MRNYEFKLTPAYCLYNGIAVVSQTGARICFMTENPSDNELKERLRKAFVNYVNYTLRQSDCPSAFLAVPDISFIAGTRREIRKYVSKLYTIPVASENSFSGNETAEKLAAEKQEKEAAAVILLDSIIADARDRGATDIHIEKNTIKFRIYGKLESVASVSEDKIAELIQRVKFLAGMNVLERRRSQDGHFVYGNTAPVFVRVSVMGIVGNNMEKAEESVVIRLLDTQRIPLALDKLGLTEIQTEKVRKMTEEKNGLIIICGPTGAGKSTTTAAALIDIAERNKGSVKIVSMEDPPEYVIPGVTQIQIDERMQNSFSEALRNVFRQDPDILMIGEIRDEKTAAVAIRAALTGHLVLATLHTSTAAEAVLRLEDLGIPKKMLASVLRGVIAQELKSLGNTVSLAADIAVPSLRFNSIASKEIPESELEKYFEHCTNYRQVLDKTLDILADRHKRINKEKTKPAGKKEAVIIPHKKSGSKRKAAG